jgi:hypothetical protein
MIPFRATTLEPSGHHEERRRVRQDLRDRGEQRGLVGPRLVGMLAGTRISDPGLGRTCAADGCCAAARPGATAASATNKTIRIYVTFSKGSGKPEG